MHRILYKKLLTNKFYILYIPPGGISPSYFLHAEIFESPLAYTQIKSQFHLKTHQIPIIYTHSSSPLSPAHKNSHSLKMPDWAYADNAKR